MRPTMSAISIIVTPNAADAGRRNLLSDPMNILATCGETRPTNPIGPVKLTRPAVVRDAMSNPIILNRSASTPRDLALSSPDDRTFRRVAISIMAAIPATVNAAHTGRIVQSAYPREPTPQL